MDQNNQGRRPHYHRGRRGPDRRGNDRRAHQPQSTAPEGSGREQTRDGGPDVEQIMREIRARISQRHGIEFSPQQIQELAARRLEAILDPRAVQPALMEQLRKGAAALPEPPAPAPGYTFDDTTLYETHRGVLRFIRRLLNPILKLFFNPNPITQALNAQARLNAEAGAREAERERRQAEWNALHYDVLRRQVTENSRLSLEMQALSLRVDSLGAKVDFNERRVRSLEVPTPGTRPAPQPRPVPDVIAPAAAGTAEPLAAAPTVEGGAEGKSRRRRRRRGRRAGGASPEAAAAGADVATDLEDVDAADAEDGADEEPAAVTEPAAPVSSPDLAELPIEAPVSVEASLHPEPHPPFPPAPAPPAEPAPVTEAADAGTPGPPEGEPPSIPSAPPDEPGSLERAAVDPGPPDR